MVTAGRQRRARGEGRWLLPLVIVIAALAVAGGLVGRRLYQQAAAARAQPGVASVTSGAASPSRAAPDSTTVALTPDAARHPMHRVLAERLQRYFDAINGKNYRLWRSTVTSAVAATMPRPVWLDDFRTTRDSNIRVYRIEAGRRGELLVLLSFVSTQAISDAPSDFARGCIRWRVVFPLALQNGSWRISSDKAGSTPQRAACSG